MWVCANENPRFNHREHKGGTERHRETQSFYKRINV